MVNADDLTGFPEILLKHIVPALGAVVAFFVFLAPMVIILRARKTGRLGQINPVPYPCQIGNCIAWIAYGCLTVDYYLVWANVPGLLLGIFYGLMSFALAYKEEFDDRMHARAINPISVDVMMAADSAGERTPALANGNAAAKADQSGSTLVPMPTANVTVSDPARKSPEWYNLRTSRVVIAMMFVVVVDFTAIWVSCFYLDEDAAKTTLGSVANFMVSLLYISPLVTMYTVIKTRNAASIDPRWAGAQLANCVLWSIYGFVMNDPMIYAVNILGIGTAFIQYGLLVLFGDFNCCSRRKTKSDAEDGRATDQESQALGSSPTASAVAAPTPSNEGEDNKDKSTTRPRGGSSTSKALDPAVTANSAGTPEADEIVDLDVDDASDVDCPRSV